jgi:hypothetical protein
VCRDNLARGQTAFVIYPSFYIFWNILVYVIVLPNWLRFYKRSIEFYAIVTIFIYLNKNTNLNWGGSDISCCLISIWHYLCVCFEVGERPCDVLFCFLLFWFSIKYKYDFFFESKYKYDFFFCYCIFITIHEESSTLQGSGWLKSANYMKNI